MNIYTEWSMKTVNPLFSPPRRSCVFQTLLGWGCLFSPAKMVVSLLHEELQCTQVREVGGLSVKDQKQIRISNTWINHPGSVLQSIIYKWRMIMGGGRLLTFFPWKGGLIREKVEGGRCLRDSELIWERGLNTGFTVYRCIDDFFSS